MSNVSLTNPSGDKQYAATLVRSQRITPPNSTEDVRHLVFRRDDPSFSCKTGQCVRVMAPGQYGNKYHPRLYLVADNDVERDGGVEFAVFLDLFTVDGSGQIEFDFAVDRVGAGVAENRTVFEIQF